MNKRAQKWDLAFEVFRRTSSLIFFLPASPPPPFFNLLKCLCEHFVSATIEMVTEEGERDRPEI